MTTDYGQQFNHHCLLTFYGRAGKITEVRGNVVWAMLFDPYYQDHFPVAIDISAVDWEAYTKKALEMDYARTP